MRCDAANMLRQAANAINPETDRYAYACALEDMADHIQQVRSGEVPIEEFTRFYMIEPEASK